MNLLIVDTTQKSATIIGFINGINYTEIIDSQSKHSETFLPSVENMLTKAKTTINEIDVFGCVTGPGSFTGIRIGMATIKAFVHALNKKLVSDNIFEVLKSYVKNGNVLLVSTNTSYYYAKIKNSNVQSVGVASHEKVHNIIKASEKVFCLHSEQEQVQKSYNNIETIKNYSYLLYQHFYNKVLNGNFTDVVRFEPFYIQVSQAERDIKSGEKLD